MWFCSFRVLFMILACGIYLLSYGGVDALVDDGAADQLNEPEEPQHRVAAIRIRVTTNDRELCAKQSRYRPHYPRCQEYCDKLGHWLGMCRKKTYCYCYRW